MERRTQSFQVFFKEGRSDWAHSCENAMRRLKCLHANEGVAK
jgi:hypothetical protein